MKHLFLIILIISYSNAISQTQVGADIDGTQLYERSGLTVTLSHDGSLLGVGAPYNSEFFSHQGKVKICLLENGAWVVKDSLYGNQLFRRYGHSLCLADNSAVVAIGGFSQTGGDSGYVQVYEYNNWNRSQRGVDFRGQNSGDRFGASVSLSGNGDTIAIGAPGYDTLGTNTGLIRVFGYTNGSWNQIGNDILNLTGSGIGEHVELSANGTRLAFSGQGGDLEVVEYVNGQWIQIGQGFNPFDNWSFSGDGRHIALGRGGNPAEEVEVQEFTNNTWNQKGQIISSPNTQYWEGFGWGGISISHDGNRVGVHSYNAGLVVWYDTTGVTRIFQYDSGSWTQTGMDIFGEDPGESHFEFHWHPLKKNLSISGDGDFVAIGGPGNDKGGGNKGNQYGSTRVFSIPNTINIGENHLTTSIHPNPSNGSIIIRNTKIGSLCKVYNATGVKVYEVVIPSLEEKIDLSELPLGTYLIQISNLENTETHRIILQ